MAHNISPIPVDKFSWHKVPDPRRVVMVACERSDGTLNVHDENETCDICSPTVRPDETLDSK